MNIADNLQRLRRMKNLSQEELAERCNVSRQAIAKWESGESVPTLDKLIFLADLYELSLDELVGRVKIDRYMQFKEYIYEHAAEDIPTDDDDDISAIIRRYLVFMDSLELSPEDKLEGLKKIFLDDVNVEKK